MFRRRRNKKIGILSTEINSNTNKSSLFNKSLYSSHKSRYYRGNVFSLCGAGLYIITGKTKSGKNVLLQNIVQSYTKKEGVFKNCFVVCQKFSKNKEFNYLNDCCDKVCYTSSTLKIDKCKDRSLKYEEKLEKANINTIAWKNRNKVLVIFNDFFGLCKLETKGNKIFNMVSYLRHVGKWFIVILTQSVTALHPDFYANSNILVTFDSQKRIMKHIEQKTSYDVDIPKMLHWNRQRYHFCMIINDTEKDIKNNDVISMGLNYIKPVKYLNKLQTIK